MEASGLGGAGCDLGCCLVERPPPIGVRVQKMTQLGIWDSIFQGPRCTRRPRRHGRYQGTLPNPETAPRSGCLAAERLVF